MYYITRILFKIEICINLKIIEIIVKLKNASHPKLIYVKKIIKNIKIVILKDYIGN
jgi:hypothetical protein